MNKERKPLFDVLASVFAHLSFALIVISFIYHEFNGYEHYADIGYFFFVILIVFALVIIRADHPIYRQIGYGMLLFSSISLYFGLSTPLSNWSFFFDIATIATLTLAGLCFLLPRLPRLFHRMKEYQNARKS